MLKIFYDEKGLSYSDFSVDYFISEIATTYDYITDDVVIRTSTENLIYAVRCAIVKGSINQEYIEVHFKESVVKFDKDARIQGGDWSPYPETYFDKALNILIGL